MATPRGSTVWPACPGVGCAARLVLWGIPFTWDADAKTCCNMPRGEANRLLLGRLTGDPNGKGSDMENVQPTHRISLNGDVAYCTPETFQEVAGKLVIKHGGGVPHVEPLQQTRGPAPTEPAPPPAPTEPPPATNRDRAVADAAAALENGFQLAPPIYSIGTAVNELGVENARRSQLEHEAKPLIQEACEALRDKVHAEQRQDLPVLLVGDMRMDKTGRLVLPGGHPVFGGARVPLTRRGFNGLFARFPCTNASAYLADCPVKLRAVNFNHWAEHVQRTEQSAEVVVRTRLIGGARTGFAAVSPKYTPYDADSIAEALALAFPSDARGAIDYTGDRLRVEGLWHTDIAPEDFVAGEIFKAGVIVRSDDTGGGSIRVSSVVWRNLCLNLIILDKAIGVDERIRHTGNVRQLAAKFRAAFSRALQSVDVFRRAWSAARHEEGRALIEAVQGTTRENITSLPVEDVLPGIFAGVVKRDLVPVRGRVENVVPKLLEMHSLEPARDQYGVSRASIANAFTRYAHEVEVSPFAADAIREGAGGLLVGQRGRAPAPLPYEPFRV